MSNVHVYVEFVLRWIHFIAGVIWIGHLYFFNFVNSVFAKTLDAETKRKVVPELMPRALFWFRWGAMFTFLSGYGIIIWKMFVVSNAGLTGEGGLFTSSWGQWITLGTILGTIMWFNVWFIIWPAQKKIIPWIKAGESPAEMPGLVAKATLASKVNTYFSVPLLFFMGAASHLPVINPVLIILAFAVGLGAVWYLYSAAPKVGVLK